VNLQYFTFWACNEWFWDTRKLLGDIKKHVIYADVKFLLCYHTFSQNFHCLQQMIRSDIIWDKTNFSIISYKTCQIFLMYSPSEDGVSLDEFITATQKLYAKKLSRYSKSVEVSNWSWQWLIFWQLKSEILASMWARQCAGRASNDAWYTYNLFIMLSLQNEVILVAIITESQILVGSKWNEEIWAVCSADNFIQYEGTWFC
jgi:hypothetical protein